jgi:hypothetical protein
VTIFFSENLKGKDLLVDIDPGINKKIILKWILWKLGGKLWTGFVWFRIRTSIGHL